MGFGNSNSIAYICNDIQPNRHRTTTLISKDSYTHLVRYTSPKRGGENLNSITAYVYIIY